MPNKIPNRKAVCDALVSAATLDRDIVILCSDSRGSASMDDFIRTYPERVIEVGIAEQDLVGISAGLASCGKKPFAVSPASFLSTRSIEQVKIDVAYSNTNVKLIGISGGISYGALGMSHHSAQDIAMMAAIPNMRVYLPSDRHQTAWLISELLKDSKPAYVRVGRNPVEDVYNENTHFEMNRAKLLRDGSDLGIIACGEMVQAAIQAAEQLETMGISCSVADMYCLKPFDAGTVSGMAKRTKALITIEEHAFTGGLGSMVCQTVCSEGGGRVACLALPDEPVIAGKSSEVFAYYSLDAEGIVRKGLELLKGC